MSVLLVSIPGRWRWRGRDPGVGGAQLGGAGGGVVEVQQRHHQPRHHHAHAATNSLIQYCLNLESASIGTIGTINQEKALEGAFFVIVKSLRTLV